MRIFDLFCFKYNRTDFHELNLDWIISDLRTLAETLENFISLNTIKYADPIQWNITKQYGTNTVVIDPNTGTAYLSTQPVPSGVGITNTDYWIPIFTLDLISANQNITLHDDGSNVIATFDSDAEAWLIWNGTLYKTMIAIPTNTAYVVGYNLERYTVEMFLNDAITSIKNIIGELSDLDTFDKTSIVNAINELVTSIGGIKTKVLNLNITTPEMYGAVGDGVTDDTQAVQDAFSIGNFIVCSKQYKITNTLFIEGDKTICGGGTFLGYLPAVSTDEYLLILGNPGIGESGEKFTGSLRDITFKCYTGNYNYIVCGGNSEHVLVDHCIFDSSNGNCHNKMLFFGPDNVVCPMSSDNDLTGYTVLNSTFIYDTTQGVNNLCESVGCSHRIDVNIENNLIYHADDDLGVHQCANVTIRDNRMLDNHSGRIYVSNSQFVKILNNEIVQDNDIITMGIYVCWETSAVSATETPSDFEIAGNVIDYSKDTLTTATYGIRCTGIRGKIHDNYLIGTYPYNGRIVVENQAASGSLSNLLVSDNIDIYNNRCTELFESANGSAATDDVNINIFDNVCDSIYSFYNANQVHHNRVKSSISRVYDTSYVPYNMLWQFEGTGTATVQSMKCNGLTSFRFTEKVMLSNYIGFTTDVDVPLSGSNYYRLSFYKNGTLIRHVTLQGQDYTVTNFNSVTFEAGDVLTVGYSFSGTVPSTQPNVANVQLKYFSFADFS